MTKAQEFQPGQTALFLGRPVIVVGKLDIGFIQGYQIKSLDGQRGQARPGELTELPESDAA